MKVLVNERLLSFDGLEKLLQLGLGHLSKHCLQHAAQRDFDIL
jgi:hypothetical protein